MDIAPYPRMFLYVWSEKDKPDECKFGQKWVHAKKSAYKAVYARVKEGLGTRKDLLKTGVVTIDSYWDVSDWAILAGRFHKRAKMDDYVRAFVGYRKFTTGEIHTLSSSDLILKVNLLLHAQNQPLPPVALSTMQAQMAEQVLDAFDAGKHVVLAELCARFGKTIWSGAVALELNANLVIVASYVKTVFASFAKDLTSYAQWSGHVHVDTQEPNWQTQVHTALKADLPVVAYVSMAPGSLRDARIQWLMAQPEHTLLILDEADFGSHTPKQAHALQQYVQPHHKVLIMTGTNSDRAVKLWKVDHMVSVTYPELLIQKIISQGQLAAGAPSQQPHTALSHFMVDLVRDCVMPSISMYQLDLSEPVAQSAASGEMDAEMSELPSWAKFAAHPVKSKGFFVRILETVFLGKHQVEAANADLQTLNWFGREKTKVCMMFLPHQTGVNSGALKAVGQIAAQTLPAWRVLVLGGGDIRVANHKVKNHNAERTVSEQVEQATKQGQSVLILSSQMAQRSFSIPEITELYLAYDAGQAGATIQKMSRVLTPGSDPSKVGKIISLSFDPNRDDKFDSLVLETVNNIAKREPARDVAEIMAQVLSTMDIWKGGAHTGTKVVPDVFLQQVIASNSVNRVLGATADLTTLSKDEIRELAHGHVTYTRVNPVAHVPKGKTQQNKVKPKPKGGDRDQDIKEAQLARERIVAVADNIDMILAVSGMDQIWSALQVVDADPDLQLELEQEFGMRWSTVHNLFKNKTINPTILSIRLMTPREG